jgi:hypothetical protein
MALSVTVRLVPLLLKLFPLFEPLLPSYISLRLRRLFRRWKEQGMILSYRTRTTRMGKLHYKVSVDLDLTSEQAQMMLKEASTRIMLTLPRNGEEVIEWLMKRKVT